MMFCEKCGRKLEDGAKFCEGCGAPVAEPVPAIRLCAGCGAQLEPGTKFCMKCGLAVGAPALVTVSEDGPSIILDVMNVDALKPAEVESASEPASELESEPEDEFDFPLPSLE